jgi:hypothetical protein
LYLHCIADDGNHRTHFTGFMLEEEIVASLWGFRFNIQNERRHENVLREMLG